MIYIYSVFSKGGNWVVFDFMYDVWLVVVLLVVVIMVGFIGLGLMCGVNVLLI